MVKRIIPSELDGDELFRRNGEYVSAADYDALEDALRAIIRDVNDYEKANNLHPNPGRTECWDSVARAKALLEQSAT